MRNLAHSLRFVGSALLLSSHLACGSAGDTAPPAGGAGAGQAVSGTQPDDGAGGAASTFGTGGSPFGSAGMNGENARAGASGSVAGGAGAGGSGAGGQDATGGAGGVGGAGGANAMCVAGDAGACDDKNPCTRDTCMGGVCTHAVDDKAAAPQIPGNCIKEACLNGALASTVDDTDTPDAAADGNACTVEVCMSGIVTPGGNAPRGVPCVQTGAMPGECDGDGKCGAVPAVGDSCAKPIVIDPATLPVMLKASTLDFGPDYGFPSNTCPGEVSGWGGSLGKGSPDVVYSFTPTKDGAYNFALTPTGFAATLYVVTGDCSRITAASCVGATPVGMSQSVVSASLKAGTTYYVIVDGFSATDSKVGGPFTLGVGVPEKGNCTDMVDNDANGKTDCADPGCANDPACVPVGDLCVRPITIGALPFTAMGDSSQGFFDDYHTSGSVCPGLSFSVGVNSPDVVYAFTPTYTGPFDIMVSGAFTPAVYVTTDCANIAMTCIAGDSTGMLVNRTLTAGTTYYIIVDAAFSGAGAFTVSVTRREAPDCADGIDNDGDGRIDCNDRDCNGIGTCPAAPGDKCTDAIAVTVPFSETNDTSKFYLNDYKIAGSGSECGGAFFGTIGASAPDVVYAITPPSTGVYDIKVKSLFSSAVYVTTDCSAIATSCIAGSDMGNIASLALTGGITYYVVVDGYSSDRGSFSIAITRHEAPDCSDGIDNNGNGLIDCADPECAGIGACPATPGDMCSSGFPITSLPFHASGDTSSMKNDYQFSSGACPGIFGAGGSNAPDVVYTFTPTVTGNYRIAVNATFDATVIIASDCGAIDNTCLAGGDSVGAPDVIPSVALAAGTPYFIIVDGYSSGKGTFTIDVTKNP